MRLNRAAELFSAVRELRSIRRGDSMKESGHVPITALSGQPVRMDVTISQELLGFQDTSARNRDANRDTDLNPDCRTWGDSFAILGNSRPHQARSSMTVRSSTGSFN